MLLCVLSVSSGGQEKHGVTGTTLFPPTDTECVMKSGSERKKMADKEEWEEMKQEACVRLLHWVLLLPVRSIHFSSLWSQRKKRKDISLCVCMLLCVHVRVTSYPHKRFCILSALFILPFIRTVLFSADHLMSCPGLSCFGKKHSNS